MSFPSNYPNSPPSVKFTSEIWHPNGKLSNYNIFDFLLLLVAYSVKLILVVPSIAVYPDGRVCISILHPPGEDPNGYELASERWTPVHTVRHKLVKLLFLSCFMA